MFWGAKIATFSVGRAELGRVVCIIVFEANFCNELVNAFCSILSNVHDILPTSKFKGAEDCLFLNVYAPNYSIQPGANLPVMVWVHGGGFIFGSGGNDEYGPERIMEEGKVVLVTLNYRLGPMGFLSLGNENISGRCRKSPHCFL